MNNFHFLSELANTLDNGSSEKSHSAKGETLMSTFPMPVLTLIEGGFKEDANGLNDDMSNHTGLPSSGCLSVKSEPLEMTDSPQGRILAHHNNFSFSPLPTSPHLPPQNHQQLVFPQSTLLTSAFLNTKCVVCGEVFESSQDGLLKCPTPACRRSFCSRCVSSAADKGVGLITPETSFCAICQYQSLRRPDVASHEWHWTFHDPVDLEFTRSLRDSLPSVPGLFLEIHALRQACWRRRISGIRKHYSFKQHGGFFEGRLQALQISAQLAAAQSVMLSVNPVLDAIKCRCGGGFSSVGNSSPYMHGGCLPSQTPNGLLVTQPLMNISQLTTNISGSEGSSFEIYSQSDYPVVKRKPDGGPMDIMQSKKRKNVVEQSASIPALSRWPSSAMHLVEPKKLGLPSLLDAIITPGEGSIKSEQAETKMQPETMHSLAQSMHYTGQNLLWKMESDDNDTRCAICCGFITDTKPFACRVGACSRVYCPRCVKEGEELGIQHFHYQSGFCAICQYQHQKRQNGHSVKPIELWHIEFDSNDAEFLKHYVTSLPALAEIWFDVERLAWCSATNSWSLSSHQGLFEARWLAVQSIVNGEEFTFGDIRITT